MSPYQDNAEQQGMRETSKALEVEGDTCKLASKMIFHLLESELPEEVVRMTDPRISHLPLLTC